MGIEQFPKVDCERLRQEWRDSVPHMALLIGLVTVKDKTIIKGLESSGLTNSDGTVITIMRKTAGARVAKVGGDGKGDSFRV